MVALDDVVANPDGHYVRSLQTQLSHGDARIIQSVGEVFHLCTRPMATPDTDATRALLVMEEREVKYLFVPASHPTDRPSS